MSQIDRPTSEWVTGGDAPTDKQLDFAKSLSDQKGIPLPHDLNKASASEFIDRAKNASDSKAPEQAQETAEAKGADAHLDKPQQWSTGGEDATSKQKGYIAVLEKQAGEKVTQGKGLDKSEASERIEELKSKTDG